MVKHVLRDYIYQWRNIKERRVWEEMLIIMACSFGCVVYPYNLCPHLIGALYVLLPMIIACVISRMYPNEMPLIAHLCPMSTEEKKKYVVVGFWIRVIVSTLAYLLLAAVVIFAGVPVGLHMLLDFINYVLAVIIFNLYSQPTEVDTGKRVGMEGLTYSMTVCQYVALFCLLSGAFIDRKSLLDGYEFNYELSMVVLVVMVITCLYMVIRFYPIVMSIGTGYRDIHQKKRENS